jgi:hypothetical protein
MAAAKITLVLGSHAHVPYGSETSEFEKVYTGLVRPFISGLCKHPQIQAALHYSGVLLHWIERSHPEMVMSIEEMVSRKQVEMLGGGFYEPMLPIIPLQDKIGQIELLTTYLRKQFGKRPQGCWIPAFAWEQGLVSPLAACGMGFTFLSERQFTLEGNGHTAVGMAAADLAAPCICEDQGKVITVFPVMQSLETALAGKTVSSLLPPLLENYNKRQAEEAEVIVSIFPQKINADQDESPDHAWCRFFEELSLCENYAETVIPGKLVKGLKNLRKRCFPASSDTPASISSRRFIIVHPEAGGIYAKMIFTNVLINQLRGDKSRKLSAHEELWKAQDRTLFCKTGREGLHNHLLRNAAYSALLGAERVTREKTRNSSFVPSLVPYDFNMDGEQEWLFQDIRINCYVQSTGGGIFELDYLPRAWNYLDTSGGRSAFADRLLPSAFKAENLACDIVDGARLCRNERYESSELDKVRRRLCLTLKPPASSKPPFGAVEIEKNYTLKKDAIHTGYVLINGGAERAAFQFAPEIDLALPGEGDDSVRFFVCKAGQPAAQPDAPLAQPLFFGADGLKLHDIKNEVQITLSANRPFDGKVVPVYTRDEITGAPLYQSLCVMPMLPVLLEPGEKWEIEFMLRFSH